METTHLEIVSRHPTSEGVVVYARCACGRLVVLRDGAELLTGASCAAC